MLYVNQSKFKYTYLNILKNYLEYIFNKKVEFNLINLKYNYLNSEILSESITLKITRNKSSLLKVFSRLMRKIRVTKPDKSVYKPNVDKINLITNINDPVESLFDNQSRPDENSLKKIVLEDIKYKRISGLRLEASGRLTRRFTASRSLTKLKYKGSLINADSAYRGLSTVILKGNLRPNLQYSKLKSKTRIGSFGLKT
jgi:hypothetical protein